LQIFRGQSAEVTDQLKQHVQQLKVEQNELQDSRTKQKEVQTAMENFHAKIVYKQAAHLASFSSVLKASSTCWCHSLLLPWVLPAARGGCFAQTEDTV